MVNENAELTFAEEYVRLTDHNLFLTGKAGTGKTTFLLNLKKNPPKRMIVTAPTGVAAINAGGVTIHSFFQLPFSPFIPDNTQQTTQIHFNKEKINIIRTLELLVIDEISMVRADVLDGIDFLLRRYRRSDRPFGGVQLLMIGDLHQLSPVVKNDERDILKQYYDTCYFFSSKALQAAPFQPIELKYIYRQSDQDFIQLLNKVRKNRLDKASLDLLNSRFEPELDDTQSEDHITLTTHNREADHINQLKLDELSGDIHQFSARVSGNYPEYAFPTGMNLALKKNAQVMFVRNDPSPEKRYFNGKIGLVNTISYNHISVKCPGEDESIDVEIATWENVKYQIDDETKEIKEELIGSFSQYPLKLAWAITIHKSQGLTFDKVAIDAGAAFAHGQVYVALSRCRTFEGIQLRSPIPAQAIKADHEIAQFVAYTEQNPPNQQQLRLSKIAYQEQKVLECFDFQMLRISLLSLNKLVRPNTQVLEFSATKSLEETINNTTNQIIQIGEKFKRELHSLFKSHDMPEENEALQGRIIKASGYFTLKLADILTDWLESIRIETDNKELRKKSSRALTLLRQTITTKVAAIQSCNNGFSTRAYLSAIVQAEIDSALQSNSKPKIKIQREYQASDVRHPKLLEALKSWRNNKAATEQVEPYRILHQRVIIQIAAILPCNIDQLESIKGFGSKSVEKYGKDLVHIIKEYCEDHNIDPMQTELPNPNDSPEAPDKEPTSSPKKSTKERSYDLFKHGKNIDEIANERGFVSSTILSHLAYYVRSGDIKILELIPQEKLSIIMNAFAEQGKQNQDLNLKPIKLSLGDKASYSEIKLVSQHMAYMEEV